MSERDRVEALLALLDESDLRQREVLARQADLERRVAAVESGQAPVKDEASPLVDRMAEAIRYATPTEVKDSEARAALSVARADLLADATDAEVADFIKVANSDGPGYAATSYMAQAAALSAFLASRRQR